MPKRPPRVRRQQRRGVVVVVVAAAAAAVVVVVVVGSGGAAMAGFDHTRFVSHSRSVTVQQSFGIERHFAPASSLHMVTL